MAGREDAARRNHGPRPGRARHDQRVPRRYVPLAATAAAYSLAHHLGSLPHGLGPAPEGTRVADWLDLLIPFLVLGPALWALVEAHTTRARQLAFAAGALLYATGHGIHLAANSIGNAAPGETAHLWDERVGHLVWYAGVAVVFAVLASTLTREAPTTHPAAWLLAVAVGATWGTNATGGGLTWPGAAVAAAALAWGVAHRRTRAALTAAVGAAGLVAIVVSAAVR
jgi:hypothetical protein